MGARIDARPTLPPASAAAGPNSAESMSLLGW
jgi:hypothetical protein